MAKNQKPNVSNPYTDLAKRGGVAGGGKDAFVCYCNRVPKEPIEAAIRRGCDLNRIFDATCAGVGACGGSCRPYLLKMIHQFQETGEFPNEPRFDPRPKSRR